LALEDSKQVIFTTVISVIIGMIIAVGIFLYMSSRMIIKPVHLLSSAMSHFAESDYSHLITYYLLLITIVTKLGFWPTMRD